MKQIPFALAIILVAAAPVARAQYHVEDPRLQKLFSTFIAPCCWRENLTLHDSEIAREMRDRIRTMVREGRSDDEIKAVFVRQYTKRILALPEGSSGTWLFLTPWLAFLAGVAVIVLVMRHLRTRSTAPLAAGLPPAKLEDGWDLE